MKLFNWIFTLFFLFFLIPSSYSQNLKKFDYRIFVGINSSFLIGKDANEYMLYLNQSMEPYSLLGINWSNAFIPRLGISSGLIAESLITKNFGFRTGFNFSQRGFLIKQEWELPSNDLELSSLSYKFEESKNINLNYLDFPILFTRSIKNKFNIVFGGIISFMLSENVIVNTKEEYQTYDTDGNIELISDDSSVHGNYSRLISDDYPDSFIQGLCVGFGYQIKRLGVFSNITKYSSFGSINGGGGNNKNLVFNLSLSYKIK